MSKKEDLELQDTMLISDNQYENKENEKENESSGEKEQEKEKEKTAKDIFNEWMGNSTAHATPRLFKDIMIHLKRFCLNGSPI